MLNYRLSIALIRRYRQSWFSLSFFRARSPHGIHVLSLLHTQLPLQSQTCSRRSLTRKGYKIHLIRHFSVRTYYNSTFQPKLGTLINLQDPYLRTTSSVNLSPTQSPNIKLLFKRGCSSGARTWLLELRQYVTGLMYLANNS